jgi:hypothetical protein
MVEKMNLFDEVFDFSNQELYAKLDLENNDAIIEAAYKSDIQKEMKSCQAELAK